MVKKLQQYIDGIDGTALKNYLFCQRNGIIVRESELNDIINPYIDSMRSDALLLLRMERVINKPFTEITLTDLLTLNTEDRTYFKYKSVISNIFFRYFNIKIVEDIFIATTLSKTEIEKRFGGLEQKCDYLSKCVYNENDYKNKYSKVDNILINRFGNLSDDILQNSVDFAVLLINELLDSDDPYKAFSDLCNKYNVRYSTRSSNYVKAFMKNTAFYKNYRRHFNNVIKKGEITYKGEIWKISKIYIKLPFLYYIWATIKGEIPGRKWDKKLGVVKTDE